jgi:hypothetical protein
MKPNEKANARHAGLNELSERKLQMNTTPTQNNFQFNSRRELLDATKLSRLPVRKPFTMTNFVCDVCALPLSLYGANFIETYSNGRVNILRCLCDLHADEMEVNAQ